MKLTPGGTIMHHAAPVKSTGKIQQAFIKGNPNLTSKDYFAIQRRVEKELGIAFGDFTFKINDIQKLLQNITNIISYCVNIKFMQLIINLKN